MRIVLDEPIECWVPTQLGDANVIGYLWHRPHGGKWKRRFAVCVSNFIILFAEKDAPGDNSAVYSAKPVGAICFEDLEVAPIDPHPAERSC